MKYGGMTSDELMRNLEWGDMLVVKENDEDRLAVVIGFPCAMVRAAVKGSHDTVHYPFQWLAAHVQSVTRDGKVAWKRPGHRCIVVDVLGRGEDMVLIRIAEQSHRGEDFTSGGCCFGGHLSGYLVSTGSDPGFAYIGGDGPMFRVRGAWELCDHNVISIPSVYWPAIAAALQAYNDELGDGRCAVLHPERAGCTEDKR